MNGNNTENNIKIIRSVRRRRVVLRAAGNGDIELLVPQSYPESAALQLLRQNAAVINRLREKAKQISAAVPKFSDEVPLFFLGKTYPLFQSLRLKQFDGERFMVPAGSTDDRLDILETVYKKLARNYIIPRVKELAAKFQISVGTIKINSAVTRWGSCSAQGNLNFSWRLIRCPEELIDSVICHELAHRFELNHSPKFYRQLRKLDPLYAEHRQTLRLFSRQHPWFR